MKTIARTYRFLADRSKKLLREFVQWRLKNISHRTFLLILSVLVGFTSGLVAVTIKNTVHVIQTLVVNGLFSKVQHLMYFVLPALGILITYSIIRWVIRKPVGEGVPIILYSLSRLGGKIPSFHTYASLITAPFTVAFGGSVGLEAPTVITGSAIGSYFGRLFHFDFKMRTLLIGCATAGAVSSIFNAPIAGIVFVLEVIMIDLNTTSLVPLLMASASASVTSRLFLGNDTLFHFPLTEGMQLMDVPFYILLGLIAGLFSVYFTVSFLSIGKVLGRQRNPYLRIAIGGSVLGLLIFVFPPLYGEGFDLINSLIDGHYAHIFTRSLFVGLESDLPLMLLFLGGVVVFKAIATSVTIGSGGIGGIFAPTLFMGSTIGFIVAKVCIMLGFDNISVINFTMVGMAALMGGNMRAPLTAIFLIAEITNGYSLFVPLMIAVSVSFLMARSLFAHSVYNFRLASRGELLTHHSDRNVLTLLRIEQLLEKNLMCVRPEMSLGQLVNVIRASSRNIFPVVDDEEKLVGVIVLDDVREIMFDTSRYETVTVAELMKEPIGTVEVTDTMEKVVNTFRDTDAWNLPVLENGKYRGFISRSKLFTEYRKMLVTFSED
ncbi:MAG: CBS domain-containing protein [Flavobacteriales bacterium]|nr:CBS domain-containing protein [Flavobacteriales bacterium]